MVQDGLVRVGIPRVARYGNQVREGTGSDFADSAGPTERACGVESGHLNEDARRKVTRRRGHRPHFAEHIQFWQLAAHGPGAGEAVGAKTNVHSCTFQFVTGEASMSEVSVALRTVNDMTSAFTKQHRVPVPEVIHMNREKAGAQHAALRDVLHRGALSAVAHVALAVEQIEERTAAVHEHFKFGGGFREVRGYQQFSFTRFGCCESQKVHSGGVWGVRRKTDTAVTWKSVDVLKGFLKNGAWNSS